MKTFVVLFIIAASMPADAQRVKENVRQYTEIIEQESGSVPVEEVVVEPVLPKKGKAKKAPDALPKG
jgi:hypothetical protein